MRRGRGFPINIFGIVSGLAGIFSLGWGVHILTGTIATQSWPSTEGVIVHSEYYERYHTGSALNDTSPSTDYAAKIHYSYKVNGTRYLSKRMHLGEPYLQDVNDDSNVKTYLKRYPVGQNIEVFYNPSDPSEAVLERHVDFRAWCMLPVGMVFIALAVVSQVMWSRAVARRREVLEEWKAEKAARNYSGENDYVDFD